MYTPRQKTADGFEMRFGTNHLGHLAWTGLLLEHLLEVEGSRIVTLSTVGHRARSRIDFDDLQAERSYSRVAAYGRSKLSNLLFTDALQRWLESADAETVLSRLTRAAPTPSSDGTCHELDTQERLWAVSE